MRSSDSIHQSQSWIRTISNNELFKRSNFACGVYKDRYVIIAGGVNGAQEYLASMVMYDMNTHTYTRLPDLPFKGHCTGTIFQDYFFVISEYPCQIYRTCLLTLTSTSTSISYSWEKARTNINMKQTVITNVVSDGKEYFYLFDSETQNVYRYHPKTNTLMDMPNLPTFREAYTTAMVKHQIFVIGGHYGVEEVCAVEAFDVETHSWSSLPSIPQSLSFPSATVYKQWIIVTGRQHHDDANTQTFTFDTKSLTWTTSVMNNSISAEAKFYRKHKCAVVQNQALYIGGYDDEHVYDEYHPHHCDYDDSSHLSPTPTIQSIPVKYLIPDGRWELMKDFILLRELLDENRATIAFPQNSSSSNFNAIIVADMNQVIFELFTNVSIDIFRHVLIFLV